MPIQIRRVKTLEDCALCQSIEHEVWGASSACSLPQMIVHAKYGGIVLLAVSGSRPVGFLFSFPARYQSEVVLWSHVTAVLPGVLHQGIGAQLKNAQRQAARDEGYEHIVWTYDPLVARNAHFNLRKLGARIDAYQRNVYGVDEGDLVNQGLETDRFVAVWPTRDGANARAMEDASENTAVPASKGGFDDEPSMIRHKSTPIVLRLREDGSPEKQLAMTCGASVVTRIPLEYGEMASQNRKLAAEWRETFREVAESLWSSRYRPVTVEKHSDCASYIWRRDEV